VGAPQAPDGMTGFRTGALFCACASKSTHPAAGGGRTARPGAALWTTAAGVGGNPARVLQWNPKPSLREGGTWNGVALRWQVAILKILAAHADGEASVSSVARDLSILVTTKGSRPQPAPRSMSTTLFADGLIERPGKGRWRISQAGRAYLHALESPLSEAAE